MHCWKRKEPLVSSSGAIVLAQVRANASSLDLSSEDENVWKASVIYLEHVFAEESYSKFSLGAHSQRLHADTPQ